MSQSGNEVVAEVKKAIGTRVAAYFGEKMFLGIVESVVAEDNGDSYRINWEDGDVEVYDKAKLTKGISLMKTVQEMDNGAKGSKKARRESTTDPSTTATPSSSPFEPPTTVGGNPADCTDPSPQLRGTDMTTDLPTGVTKAKDKYVARIKIKGIQCRGIPRDDPNTAGRDYEVIKKQKDNLANDIADMNSCDEKRNVIEDKWKLLMEST